MAKNNKQLSNVQEVRSKNNPQLTLQQEQRLYKLHEEKHIGAFDQYKSCENVVVFGNHGCGRSAVINSLLGHQLKSIPHSTWSHYLLIDLADDPHHESKLKISHDYYNPGQETLTSIQAEDGTTIWECPGLYKRPGCTKGVEDIDEREEKIKMRESPIVMQLLKTVNSVKFILVADYNDLTVGGGWRGEKFLATVDRIASIFSDLDIIRKSILLVINKAPSFERQEGVVHMIKDTIRYRDMSDHTKTLMKYLTESPIHIFYKPEKVGEEVVGPTLELIQSLPSCDVSQSIQYPCLSPPNQELALEILAEDKAREELEKAGIDTKNISNAGFFTKVVDFLYEALASMSILTKAGQYAGGVLIALSSLISVNKLKGYFSSDKMEAVSEKDYSPQPMSAEKAKLARCLVKILNDNEDLSEEFNKKFTECIEQYTNCKNDEERQSIVKQFGEWIISETNLKNELLAFEAEVQVNLEEDLSDGDSKTQYLPDIVKIKNNFAAALKKYSASNPNIPTDTKQKFSAATLDAVSKIVTADNTIIESKDNVHTESALHNATSDETLNNLDNVVHKEGESPTEHETLDALTTTESEGEAYTEPVFNDETSDETLDNLDNSNTIKSPGEDPAEQDDIEADGYDAGIRLGGEVNNQF